MMMAPWTEICASDNTALVIRVCTDMSSWNLNTLKVSTALGLERGRHFEKRTPPRWQTEHTHTKPLRCPLIGRLRYANNSNYRNDSLLRKESESLLYERNNERLVSEVPVVTAL